MWRWIHLALTVFVLAAGAQPALGQAQERPPIADALQAAGLTAADVPRGLTLDRERSGLRAGEDGSPSYITTFVADGTGDTPIMGVVSIVQQSPSGPAGLEAVTDRFRTNLGGTRTDLPDPALGEASHAFITSRSVMGGALTATTAFVAVRRQDVVASVAVAAMGEPAQTEVALRLAQALDRRLIAALGLGS